MSQVPIEAEVLGAATPLVAQGVAVHWLGRRSKAPFDDDWSNAPPHTLESLTAAYRSGANLGVRTGEPSKTPFGYLHLIDLDIRDEAQADDAWARLLEIWPGVRNAPYVVSGSGGASRHIYLFTDQPFRGRKLARSEGFTMVFDAKKEREVKKHDWEIDFFGTRRQAVLPPSIHPESGQPYRWGREIDWDLLDLGVGPIVSSDTIASWGASTEDLNIAGDEDDLFALTRQQPMGLSEAEVQSTLDDLPLEWTDDRDQWLLVGAALHHEYEGGQLGFDRWCEWSKQSEKYDAADQVRVWKSFKGATRPVRMATLIKAAGEARLERAHEDLMDLFDDLPEQSTALTVIPAAPAPATEAEDLLHLLAPASPLPTGSIAPGADLRPKLEYDDDWRSSLKRNEEGVIKPTLHNIKLIIRNDKRLRGIVAFNEFTQELVLIKKPKIAKLRRESPNPVVQLDGAIWNVRDPVNGDLWSDSHDHAIRALLDAPDRQGGYGLSVTDRDLAAAIDMAGQENAFHPVRDYLRGLKWDGKYRVSGLFIDYVGAPDDPYHREAALLWCLGAVTRIFEPGHKFDFVPILKGMQGKRKSTFFRTMGRNWFSELEGDFHDKKAMVEQMQGSWIIEIPELQGFSKAEVTTIKGFISRQTDKVRMAYARRATNFDRQCVFAGSTNEEEFLRDSTGGRRFWPIECRVEDINIDRLLLNVDQIWAEAYVIYQEWRQRSGPGTMLPLYMQNTDAVAIAKELQENHRQQGADDILAAQIEEWLEQPINADLGFEPSEDEVPVYRDRVCGIEVWVEMMKRDRHAYSDRDQQLLARALNKVPGWSKGGRARIPVYGLQRFYYRNR